MQHLSLDVVGVGCFVHLLVPQLVVVSNGQKIEFLYVDQRLQAVVDVLAYLIVGHFLHEAPLLVGMKGQQIEIAHWILGEWRIGSDHRLREGVGRIDLVVGEEVIVGPVLVKHVLVVLVEGGLLIIGSE